MGISKLSDRLTRGNFCFISPVNTLWQITQNINFFFKKSRRYLFEMGKVHFTVFCVLCLFLGLWKEN